MNNSPIGMLDSGIGGLSVWKEVKRLLPNESIVYFGDGKNCPYGGRPADEIRGFVVEAVERLLERGAKLIVLACNTATAAAVEYLRDNYDIPFVGMEPAVKPAALTSKSGVVGILATKCSLEGDLFQKTAAKYSDKVNILTAVGESFVEIVEKSQEETAEALEKVRIVVEPLVEAGVDKIVLGCTHYPFLEANMRKVIGDRDVEIIDPAHAVAERVRFLLNENDIAAEESHVADYEFISAATEDYVEKLLKKSSVIG
ncbi:MAG: glutamate racemase [Tidjanibacter sp.]|nr:glutamate racemase [Tidjanibacter sp.]